MNNRWFFHSYWPKLYNKVRISQTFSKSLNSEHWKILIIKCFEFVSGSGLLVGGTESILFFLTGYSNDENSRHHTPYSSLNYAYFEFVYQKSRFSLIIMLSYISCLRKYFSTFPRAPSFNSAKANFIEYLQDLISDLSPVERILTSRTLFNSWYLY